MKRNQLIKSLKKQGCELLRHGAKHVIYYNPKTGKREPVPRHREIEDQLAKKIMKALSNK